MSETSLQNPIVPRASWSTLAKRTGSLATLLVLLVWSSGGAEIDFAELIASSGNMLEFAGGFLKPDFSDWTDIGAEMVITIQIYQSIRNTRNTC